ncbi:hypothetical protein LTR37_014462 [Vermiconidia calcicola]|uniref:Uncharacterized protein n=1 Tax=Vermiconidia calcicola TaxID=1690605 RepID=A0ACC3MTW3_9PEZI|nr:hypothetical protein LTR37_014462 [Vermiconidia calcicola]
MYILCTALLALWTAHAVVSQSQQHAWWKEAVIYQVYLASFKESRKENAIGYGDLDGIIDKLDHIKDLGADIVWVSPFYHSPLKDMGYDISNCDSVDPTFGGQLGDAIRLIREVHKRGMRCIHDLVINHSSNRHPWFLQSAESKTNEYRDWYFWRPPQYKNGSRYPPNNWAGNNNGSAWKYDPKTEEYYLNLFNPFQPDFNWENPDTRQAIFHDALEYWFNQGVDGFRMDAFTFYSKPHGLSDVPNCPDGEFCDASSLYLNGPREHEYLQQMNRAVLSHYMPMFTVGEYGPTYDMDIIQKCVGASRNEINTVFITNMCDIGRDGFNPVPWTLTGKGGWRDAINFTQAVGSVAAGDGSISRFANDSPKFRVQSGKALAMMLSTLSGTLSLYQGQEIGMVNVPDSWPISDYRDTYSTVYYDEALVAGGSSVGALKNLSLLARDNARPPFNWNAKEEINLADQVEDPDSVYRFWKPMLRVRKAYKDLFVYGGFEFLSLEGEKFLIYEKAAGKAKALVYINLSERTGEPPVPVPKEGEILFQTHVDRSSSTFEPFEGRIYLMQ